MSCDCPFPKRIWHKMTMSSKLETCRRFQGRCKNNKFSLHPDHQLPPYFWFYTLIVQCRSTIILSSVETAVISSWGVRHHLLCQYIISHQQSIRFLKISIKYKYNKNSFISFYHCMPLFCTPPKMTAA